MKKWYKVVQKNYHVPAEHRPLIRTVFSYAETAEHAICQKEMYGVDAETTAEECDPSDVPYMTRAFTEATVELLRDELKRRGFQVTLS